VFNKGIVVQALGGVVVSGTVTTKASPTTLNTGTGTLTVDAAGQLSTSGQLLVVTTDDMDLHGAVDSGTRALTVECTSADRTVGLGAGAGQLSLAASELQQITATGMTIGGTTCGSQTVDGVTTVSSAGISQVLTMLASRDDASVTFSSTGSSFNALSVQSDNGIAVQVDITTTGGTLFLDGDLDNSQAGDSTSNVTLGVDVTVTAFSVLTLSSTTGFLEAAGALTLAAGSGIVINDHFNAMNSGNSLVINSDNDSSGDGTLTLQTGKNLVSYNGPIQVTAFDVTIAGTIDAGADAITFHGSKPEQTIGISGSDSPTQELNIATTELDRMHAVAGITAGSSLSANVIVDSVSTASTETLGTFTLVASKAAMQVTFAAGSAGSSSFDKGIVVQTGNGIAFCANVTTRSDPSALDTTSGYVTVQQGATLSTTNQNLAITTDSIDLNGLVDTGTASLVLECSSDDQLVQIGNRYINKTFWYGNSTHNYLNKSVVAEQNDDN
jgi:hypothetical protein